MTPFLVQPGDTYWHFLANDGCLTHGDGRKVEVGKTLKIEGMPRVHHLGLHATLEPREALHWAPGSVACLVTLGGHKEHLKKLVSAQERTVLWMKDVDKILLRLSLQTISATMKSLRTLGPVDFSFHWEMIAILRKFLYRGLTSAGLKREYEAMMERHFPPSSPPVIPPSAKDQSWLIFSAESDLSFALHTLFTSTWVGARQANKAARLVATFTAISPDGYSMEAGETARVEKDKEFNLKLTQMLLAEYTKDRDSI